MTRRAALCITLLLSITCRSAWGEVNLGDSYTSLVNGSGSSCPIKLKPATSSSGVTEVLQKAETALLLLLGFGGFSVLLALLHNAVRRHVFRDQHPLDTAFDAGGNVSLSLTAVTVACQLFWPGDILHSATLTVKNGIAGTFWYNVGIIFSTFIFPIFTVHFKTKAPGAKTYLQIIQARFGRKAHRVFCFFALLTNLVITVGILLAGRATIQSLTKDTSDEFSVLVMATLFGSYSLIGGLGTTFYVSYFNGCLVFVLIVVFVVQILHNQDERWEEIGNTEKMYRTISCLQGPENNLQHSYITFRSWGAFLYGVIQVFLASAVTYCDQASWQSRIAAKPVQGVWGFLLAGFIWFTIPNVMAVTTGMAYLALSAAHNHTQLLTPGQIDEGLVTPLIAEKVLGSTGGILVLTIGAMALMSTGSGEVMAISSIIVYDIYQPYVRPFRKGLDSTRCVLCGETKKELLVKRNAPDSAALCTCISVHRCQNCIRDLASGSTLEDDFSQTKPYTCPTHGRFRDYMDYLLGLKNWCIIMVTISIIPLGLVVYEIGIDLNWIFYVGIIVVTPCFPPVVLSLVWVKATSQGVIVGSLSGLVGAIAAILVAATQYDGGLKEFLTNTVQDYSILAGTLCAFGLSLIGCVLVSLYTHRIRTEEDGQREWMKMFCIDNPLHPWETNFREELKGYEYEGRPSMDQMNAAFRTAKLVAYIGGACCIGSFAGVMPAILASVPVMKQSHFTAWLYFNQGWAILMAIIVVFAPPTEEVMKIVRQWRRNQGLKKQTPKALAVKDVDKANTYEFTAL